MLGDTFLANVRVKWVPAGTSLLLSDLTGLPLILFVSPSPLGWPFYPQSQLAPCESRDVRHLDPEPAIISQVGISSQAPLGFSGQRPMEYVSRCQPLHDEVMGKAYHVQLPGDFRPEKLYPIYCLAWK